jgi:gas vesicle protein
MRFLTGFLIGVIAGAAIILLTTPQSGRDLQRGVRSRLNNIVNDGRRAYDQRRAELEARIIELRRG